MVCGCDRCSAVGYGHTGEEMVGAALFEDERPSEEAPKLTALRMMHGSGSR
jgi:hypothetical protein